MFAPSLRLMPRTGTLPSIHAGLAPTMESIAGPRPAIEMLGRSRLRPSTARAPLQAIRYRWRTDRRTCALLAAISALQRWGEGRDQPTAMLTRLFDYRHNNQSTTRPQISSVAAPVTSEPRHEIHRGPGRDYECAQREGAGC